MNKSSIAIPPLPTLSAELRSAGDRAEMDGLGDVARTFRRWAFRAERLEKQLVAREMQAAYYELDDIEPDAQPEPAKLDGDVIRLQPFLMLIRSAATPAE